jgi:hypothetical protein
MNYLWIIIIIVIIIFIYQNSSQTKTDSVKNILENKIVGENMNKDVKDVIDILHRREDKDAHDYYDLGTMYMCHTKDIEKAYDNYIQSIYSINNRDVDYDDAVPLLYRLENIVNRSDILNIDRTTNRIRNRDVYNINSRLRNDIQNIQHEIANDRIIIAANDIPIVNRRPKNNRVGGKTRESNYTSQKAKKIERNKTWSSDYQNVHDTSILNTMKAQYDYIKNHSDTKTVPYNTFEYITNRLLAECNYDERMKKVLIKVRNDGNIPNINIGEQELLREIWRRIQSPVNKKNKSELINSLVTSLLDCIENNMVVCPTGRHSRLMASLAILDIDSKDKKIGILKTKEATRNEIYEKCAKITDKYLGEKSKTPKNIIDDYNNNKDTEEVKQLKNKISDDIMNVRHEFTGRLDERKLTDILQECKAAVL